MHHARSGRGAAGALVVVWLGLAGPVAAQAPPEPAVSAEEQKLLEEALGTDAGTEAAPSTTATTPVGPASNPNISLVLDVALSLFSAKSPLQTGAHDPRRTGVTLQQVEMHLDASVDHWFRLDASLVFSLSGVEIEEAFGTTLGLPWGLQMRAGQLLMRFGRHNATHPHAWDFADQPIVFGRFFGNEASRGLGVELSWLTPLPWYAELVASVTNADGGGTARSFYGADDLGVDGPEDLLYSLALKQFFELSPAWGLSWGLSAQLGPNPSGRDNRSEIYGTDVQLRWRCPGDPDQTAVTLRAEALFRSRQVPGAVLQDGGLMTEAVWAIDATWDVGARYEYLSAVGDVHGVGVDWLQEPWEGDRHRASLQVTWRPSHFSRVRLQANGDWPGDRDPIWAGILALELLIGSHPAHTY